MLFFYVVIGGGERIMGWMWATGGPAAVAVIVLMTASAVIAQALMARGLWGLGYHLWRAGAAAVRYFRARAH